MLADMILEWSGGGIFTPSFFVSGAMERSEKDLKEGSEKRSSLLKKWSFYKSAHSAVTYYWIKVQKRH